LEGIREVIYVNFNFKGNGWVVGVGVIDLY